MPLPKIIFNKESKTEDRTLTLQRLEEWCKATKISEMKNQILQPIIEYAKKNLLHTSITDFNYRYGPHDFEICRSVFQNADLPDVLFMQYILNQLKPYNNLNPEFDKIQALAADNKKILMCARKYDTQKKAVGLGIFGLLTRSKLVLGTSVALFLLADYVEEVRVEKALENKLSLKAAGGVFPKVDDGFDDVSGALYKVAEKGYGFANHLFSSLVTTAINKDPRKVDDRKSNSIRR